MSFTKSPTILAKNRSLLLAAVALLAVGGPTFGADVTWLGSGPAGGSYYPWSEARNWVLNRVPAAGDTVHFQGVLAGVRNVNDISGTDPVIGLALGQLLFQPSAGDVAQSWSIGGTVNAGFVQNQTSRSQSIDLLQVTNTTIDNASSRTDAGAIYLGTLNLISTRSNPATARLTPGANGIVLGEIGGAGNVTIDSPSGYVATEMNGLGLSGTITLARGTLALTGDSSVVRQTPPALKMAAGTSLNIDVALSEFGNGDLQNLASISATSGAAILRTNNGFIRSDTPISGSFIKTGAGTFAPRYIESGTNFDVREGSLSGFGTSRSLGTTTYGTVNVDANATLRVAAESVTTVQTLTGTGTVLLGPAVNPGTKTDFRLTPTGATSTSTQITGAGNVIIDGPGSVEFRGMSNYSGSTTIQNGTAIITAAVGGLGGTPVTVSGGTLAGSGRVSGVVTLKPGGTIAPARNDGTGLNTGTFTVGGLAFDQGGTVAIEFNGITAGTQVDQLAINNGGPLGNGNLTGGTLKLSRGSNFFPASGKFPRVSIVKAAGSLSGVFANITGLRVNDTYSFAVTYDAQNAYAQLADVSDTNLDNVQDYRDLYALAGSYKTGAVNQTWVNGDLSGDGTVNYTDLLLADSYVPELTKPQFDALQPQNYQLWYDYGLRHGFSVPEPASLTALSLVGLLLGRRRTR